MMLDIVIKSVVGGVIIGVVSTIAQKYPTAGAFIMGIPLVSFITLAMMHYGGVDYQTLKTFSYQTVYFVLVSLIFFPLFIWFYPGGFWIALLGSAAIVGTMMAILAKIIALHISHFIIY